MATTTFAVLPKDALLPPQTASGPSSLSPHARFWRLPHPKTGLPALFLPYHRSKDGKEGVLECQYVAPEEERSWFVGDEVVSDGRLLVLTPLDPIFLLLPVLEATTASPPLFLLSDHIFSTAASLSSYALPPPFAQLGADVDKKASGEGQATEEVKGVEGDDVLLLGQMKGVEKLMKRVCDVQEIAADLSAYRLSPTLLTAYLRKKVARLAAQPTFDRFPALTRGLAKDGLQALTAEGNVDEITDASRKEAEETEALRSEARLFHSLSLLRPYLSPTHYTLLLASYLPSTSSASSISATTSSSTPSTLTPAPTSSTTAELNPFPLYAAHLKSLVPVLSANPTPLNGAGSGSGSGGGGAKPGVKRKVSQGMAKLAKADTSGMKRMDSFFKKRVVEKEGEKVAVKGTEK